MLNFTGFCTYPLGGYVTTALLFSTLAALTTTIYATISCRFVVLTYTTNMVNSNDDDGGGSNFEDYFEQQHISNNFNTNNTTASNGVTAVYRTSLGLYQWLRPLPSTTDKSITDWTVGTCVGYQQTMLSAFQENNDDNIMFDLSRIMAIFAILLAVFQFSWMFLSSCISMNRIQMYLFIFLSVCGTVFTGMTFLFYKSTVCTTEFENSANCQIDQGGLVMIAATLSWFITFLISIYYVAPVVRVISTSDSIDFELHKTRTPEQKQKLALQREIYKELRRQQKEQKNAAAMKNNDNSKNASNNNHSDDLPLFISPRKPPGDDEDIAFQLQQQQLLQQPESISNSRNKVSQSYRQPSDPTPVIRNSFSYDSKESWLRPIPKRSSHQKKTNRQHVRSMSMEEVPITSTNFMSKLPPATASSSTIPQRPSSLSRLMMIPLPLSIPRMKASDEKEATIPTSSLSNIIVEPQETGDIEMQQPENDTFTTTSSPPPTIVPLALTATTSTATRNVPFSSEPQPPKVSPAIATIQANTALQSSGELPSATTKDSSPNHSHQLQPPASPPRQAKNPVDVYIAQRLDNIEMLTR